MNSIRANLLTLGVLFASGCASNPHPPAVVQANQVAGAPATQQAAEITPQLIARANHLRKLALEAIDHDNLTLATELAEQALATFELAHLTARRVRAESRITQAEASRTESEHALRALEADNNRIQADIQTMQDLIGVLQKTAAPVRSPDTDPHREWARVKVTQSLATDAQLLCLAAQLLGPPSPSLSSSLSKVSELQDRLKSHTSPTPIDDASRLRAACLAELTLARRKQVTTHRTEADAVLADLAKLQNIEPRRDDRGVFVELRPSGAEVLTGALAPLSDFALAHKEFPILLVTHTRYGATTEELATSKHLGEIARDTFLKRGIAPQRLTLSHAESTRPIAHDPLPAPKDSRNVRLEVVFVSPSP